MRQDTSICVDYVARVEGQGALDIKVSGGKVEYAKFSIFEPPRFFEAFLVGRRCDEVHELTSRICGICPVAHQITALRAVENALGIKVSQQTRDLRKLFALSAHISSHVLNLYFLAAPDYFGYESIIPMAQHNPDLFKRALALKKVGNDLTELIGGRSVHPISAVVGGFTALPDRDGLRAIRARLITSKEYALKDVELFSNLRIPSFERRCEHVALRSDSEYAINDGRLVSTDGLNIAESEYREYIGEKQVPHSTAKHSHVKNRSSIMVGPLPRVNLNFDKLSPDTRKAAKQIGFRPLVFKPYMSIVARALEVVNAIDESIEIIDRLKLKQEDLSFEIKAGEGAAITEAPRGILYHYYKFDREGKVEKADIVTPTAHYAFNVEKDLYELVPNLLDQPLEEAALKCEMLVRAYDPCISCSAHFVNLRVENKALRSPTIRKR